MTDNSTPGRQPERIRSSGKGARRVLFAPASGPVGTGEYYRCLCLARALIRREPSVEIHILLDRHARVTRDPAMIYHLLDATPARQRSRVETLIGQIRPALAVFDSTGRNVHFRKVKRFGGRNVWISNRPRKRAKGFRPRLMRWLDLHLMVDADHDRPHLGLIERLACRWFPDVGVEFVSAIVAEPTPGDNDRESSRSAPAVFVSGGGGYRFNGKPVPEIFLQAAVTYQRQSQRPVVVVLGPQYEGSVPAVADVTVIPQLPTESLGALLNSAGLIVAGAGNMLCAQVLLAARPCVMTAVGGTDQPTRLAHYAKAGAVIAAVLDADALAEAALEIERDEALAAELTRAAAAIGLQNNTTRITELLLALLDG